MGYSENRKDRTMKKRFAFTMTEPAESVLQLNPCESLTNILNPSGRTTKSLFCHSELVSESVPSYGQLSNIGQTLKRVQGDNFLSLRLLAMTQAFTMAEILLSLTIIGVVAAITLPSLTGNINERAWNTQRKALYARFSQAIALMPALNGYGTLTEDSSSGASDAVDTAAETFITGGLSKVLKINNVCDSEHLPDCGIPEKINTMHGSVLTVPTKMSELNPDIVSVDKSDSYGYHFSYSQLDTKAAAFETANGESILTFYNPNCISDMEINTWAESLQPKICANFVYDLNGNKGPNAVGKDIGFITALYSSDTSVVSAIPHMSDAGDSNQYDASKLCTTQDSEYRLPNRDEMASLFVNKKLVDMETGRYWTSSVVNSTEAYLIGIDFGQRASEGARSAIRDIRCIKR